MIAGWNAGQMNGFVTSADATTDGHHVMGYYDEKSLPFYHWLAGTFAMSDRYFGAALAGTWGNRDYLYAATSDGVTDTGGKKISNVPTIFDAMDAAKVTWGVYTDGTPRQDCLGWTATHVGVHKFPELLAALASGTLPAVSFVDPGPGQDEHPPANVQEGETWSRSLYQAAIASPLWKELAVFYTYDESGGLADHVPPPHACIPSPDQTAFDRYGIRVPFIVVSPWARGHFVSHVVHSHTSMLRFVELAFDLPALTARDANSDALLDLFDFRCGPALTAPPTAPLAGDGGCP
jgi:phospholipase C